MAEETFVLVGYDKDSNNYETLASNASLANIKNELIKIIMTMNSEKTKDYPFETKNGKPFDWLEIYNNAEIGNTEKRVCYTKFNHAFSICEIIWS